MALSHTTVASQMSSLYTTLKSAPDVDPTPAWVQAFMINYNADSIKGTVSPPAVTLVPMASLLNFVVSLDFGVTSTNMSNAIANYWSAQLTFGTGVACGNIVSITNDAMKIAPTIKAYLDSQISNGKTPSYDHLFAYIESQVNTIIWTVTEVCVSPVVYTCSVS